MADLDSYDRSILRILQCEGKIGNQELAEKVNLSPSPCWRRVKKLEDAGVIERYVATLNRKQLNLSAMAYVHIALLDHTQQTIEALDDFVHHQQQIVECCSITGSSDYVLKIVEKDVESLENLSCTTFCAWALRAPRPPTLHCDKKNTPQRCRYSLSIHPERRPMAALWAVLLALYAPPRTTHLGVLSPNLPTRTTQP